MVWVDLEQSYAAGAGLPPGVTCEMRLDELVGHGWLRLCDLVL